MSRNIYLYGKHACFAALDNPSRNIKKIFLSQNFNNELINNKFHSKIQIVPQDILRKYATDEASHQGIVIETTALPDLGLKVFKKPGIIIVLDHITDPHNVGAILRTAAGFNALGVLAAKDNSPEESASMAKAASGALDIIPFVKVVNLARAMEELKESGYWFIGMDGSANSGFSEVMQNWSPSAVGLVLGSEGKGLRSLTAKKCDFLVKIPISDKIESLNVSNAAAIGLYAISQSMNKGVGT